MTCLDKTYSTTQLLSKKKPIIKNYSNNNFESLLFLPKTETRKGEGGLRTKGYFKKSYDDKPLISILTVVFNGGKYLEEAILSVLEQTYDNIEYIIIDGESTDNTVEIIKKYEQHLDYWVSEPDKGIYDAWNKGVALFCGEWIGFLGADDFYLENAVGNYINKLKSEQNEILYISSKNIMCSIDKNPIKTIGSAWNWKLFSKKMNVAHVGSLHKRDLYMKYGLYDTEYQIAGDYELLLRAGESLKAEYLDLVTCFMRDGGISNSNPIVFKEAYKALRKHDPGRFLLFSIYDMGISFAKWSIKKLLGIIKSLFK